MKKIIFFTILIFSAFVIKNLVSSIYTLWQKQSLVVQAQKELEKEKNENQRLKRDFIKANTNEFIEEQARSKLLLVKEGEQKVIIPKELIASQTAQNKITENEPNWRKWWNLFF